MHLISFFATRVFALLLMLAAAGCGTGSNSSGEISGQLEPHMLVERGELQFVADSKIGQQLAKERGVPCLLFFTAEWCTYCQQMEETAFMNSEVEQLAKEFVCVLVDADRESDICRQFTIRGYPTVQFLAADGRQLHRLVGRQSTPQLTAGMQAALQRLAWLDNDHSRL